MALTEDGKLPAVIGFVPGRRYLWWTVGYHWAGRFLQEEPGGWWIDQAEVIGELGHAGRADLGPGTHEESEPCPSGRQVFIPRGAVTAVQVV